jgi:hypothetical protein
MLVAMRHLWHTAAAAGLTAAQRRCGCLTQLLLWLVRRGLECGLKHKVVCMRAQELAKETHLQQQQQKSRSSSSSQEHALVLLIELCHSGPARLGPYQ